MRRINTLEELRAEKRRLYARRLFLETEIRKDFKEIKQSFEPANLIASGARKTFASGESHFIGNSIGQVADVVARLALKRYGFLPRLIVPYLVRKVTSNMVEKNKGKIAGWIGEAFSRFAGKKSDSNGKIIKEQI